MSFEICGFIPYGVMAFVGLLIVYNVVLNRALQKTQDQMGKLEAEKLGTGGQILVCPARCVSK